jgi:hypothetical protein
MDKAHQMNQPVNIAEAIAARRSPFHVTGGQLLELGAMAKAGGFNLSGMERGYSELASVDKIGRKRMRRVLSGWTVSVSYPQQQEQFHEQDTF